MFWTVVLYLVALAIGFFLGSFAWSQIIGTIVAKQMAKGIESDGYPTHISIIAKRKASAYTLGLVIWTVIIAAAIVGCYLLFDSYTWGLVVGLAISLISTLKGIPRLKEEFMSNILDSQK